MDDDGSALGRFFGFILVTIGIFVAGVGGLCSAGIMSNGTLKDVGPTLAIFGPILFVGVLLILGGVAILKASVPGSTKDGQRDPSEEP